MPASTHLLAVSVFVVTLIATFMIAVLGRRHAGSAGDGLQGQRLNRWLIGLSAGAAANSGFVVTGAVGLGYTAGAQWVMLPLAWLLGDILFWFFFPDRINAAGQAARAETLTDLIVHDVTGNSRTALKVLVGVVILVCLTGYVSAQWIAGQKFLEGAFGFEGNVSLALFAAVIITYTAIGGFRGSVYADSLQALIRIVGTIIAIGMVALVAMRAPETFQANIAAAGPDFLNPFPQHTLLSALAFMGGFAAAAFGFGLGQPHIVSRYVAGASPEETRAAWWIYMGFVQFTWIAMTLFGMALRGVMPNLADPETGLSVFFRTEAGPFLTGLIAADIFATVAATGNSLLVVMAQTARHDLLPVARNAKGREGPLWALTAVLGVITMVASAVLPQSVVALALSSVSLMGAGLAPAVLVRVLGLPYTPPALIVSIVTGIATASVWKWASYGSFLNEALPGIAAGLVSYYIVLVASRSSIRSKTYPES